MTALSRLHCAPGIKIVSLLVHCFLLPAFQKITLLLRDSSQLNSLSHFVLHRFQSMNLQIILLILLSSRRIISAKLLLDIKCKDNPSYRFMGKNRKNCSWVNDNPIRRCPFIDDNDVKVSDECCVLTCGIPYAYKLLVVCDETKSINLGGLPSDFMGGQPT